MSILARMIGDNPVIWNYIESDAYTTVSAKHVLSRGNYVLVINYSSDNDNTGSTRVEVICNDRVVFAFKSTAEKINDGNVALIYSDDNNGYISFELVPPMGYARLSYSILRLSS